MWCSSFETDAHSIDKQNSNNELGQRQLTNQATKYSNVNSEIIESDSRMIVACEGVESSKSSSILKHVTQDTNFSSDKSENATKNINSIINIFCNIHRTVAQ